MSDLDPLRLDTGTLTRRRFVVGGIGLSALWPSALGATTASSLEAAEEKVLVVLQLTGGNDGLNTVVPHRQDAYHRARSTLALKPRALHRLDDDHGLHPELGGLAALAAEGRVALCHGVGHPFPNRSHFRSLEIWHTAEPEKPVGRVGWLGHLADQLARRHPGTIPALAVGGRELTLSMHGAEVLPPTLPDDRGFTLARSGRRIAAHRDLILGQSASGNANLELVRQAARTAYDAAGRMEKILAQPSGAAYPDRPLAQELRVIARLVAGGFGTRIFHVALGGFDTHANQESVQGALLADVDGALAAFQRDLEASGVADRVVTLVFSEFGRRVRENGSRGTDHGQANPVFLVGAPVRGGTHGTPPDLERLEDGDVPATVDFRGVYRQLEREWMGLEPFALQGAEAPRLLRG